MAFSWTGEKGGNWDIYVKLVSESEPHRLTTDPGMGVVRHADAGYEIAVAAAKRHGIKMPMLK